eukprot:6484206-Amphidinium_carterae.1
MRPPDEAKWPFQHESIPCCQMRTMFAVKEDSSLQHASGTAQLNPQRCRGSMSNSACSATRFTNRAVSLAMMSGTQSNTSVSHRQNTHSNATSSGCDCKTADGV